MILPKNYIEKIIYQRYNRSYTARNITNPVGIDSEAYPSGEPFMFCTSLGDTFTLSDIPQAFFSRKYRGQVFITYNLKYESGALTYRLPMANKVELWFEGVTEYEGYRYTTFPYKMLRISSRRNAVTFYDAYPFYNLSLNKASQRFLNDSKLPMEVSRFTKKYVEVNWESIKSYCQKDASLTARLGERLIKSFNTTHCPVPNLYSPASLAQVYFTHHAKVAYLDRFWYSYRPLVKMAMDAYSGGKFEITRRGSSQAYCYDIRSAYPFEVSRLLDLSKAKVYHEARYIKDATYAWYTARIAIECSLYHSISVLFGSLRCYPEGYFTRSLTKSEMDYLVAHNVDVKVIDAYHLDVPRHRYPYKNVIAELYSRKQEFKGKDASQYQLYKLILNGFYGKLVQLIKLPNGKLRAGKLWHPLYSSIITANVRLRMSEIQQALGDSCLAVHTDSVFTLVPLSDKLIGDKLGYFQFEGYERLLLIACGIYEFGSKVAYRGLPMRKGFKWTELLETMGKHTHLTLSVPLIISWIEATRRNKLDLVNRFLEVEKEIDLNCDRKRIWLERATPDSLLTRLANSLPLFSSG